MNYFFYVLVVLIILIYIIIFLLNYSKNIYNNYIKYLENENVDFIISEYKKRNIDNYYTEIMIIQASLIDKSLDRILDSIQYIGNIPIIASMINMKNTELITYGGYNKILNFPFNNYSNESSNWVYGGWYIAVNSRGNYICSRSNTNLFRRVTEQKNITTYYKYKSNNEINIVVTNILYKMENLILVSIRFTSKSFDTTTYIQLCEILGYCKNYIFGDNKFIIIGETSLNSKYMDVGIKNIFNDSVISSCHNDVIISSYSNIFIQSSFILLDKRLCLYGIRFGNRFVENEPELYNTYQYAIIYNSNKKEYTIDYFNDAISIAINKYYKSNSKYTDQYSNWDKIDVSNLTNEFTIDESILTIDERTSSSIMLDTELSNINESLNNI